MDDDGAAVYSVWLLPADKPTVVARRPMSGGADGAVGLKECGDRGGDWLPWPSA
jgi:hypothetical protein